MIYHTAPLPQLQTNLASICFSGLLAGRLHHEIIDLAHRKDLQDAFEFFPHVTLLGGINQPKDQVLATTEQLIEKIKSLDIKFDKVSYGEIFHQCVYILCNPSDELLAAGAEAKRAFNLDPTSTYMPHLSLVYSHIDAETRQSISAEEQDRLFGSGGGDEKGPLQVDGFLADSIAVWYTPVEDETLESWRAVAVYPLKKE